MDKELIFSVSKKDLEIDWFSGTGAGGQHRNKHMNCCRIKHKESGITAQCQEFRERQANLKTAFERLAQKLIAYYTAKEETTVDVSERVRTYHEGRNEVIDHASGVRSTYKKVVLDGDISEMIAARKLSKSEE